MQLTRNDESMHETSCNFIARTDPPKIQRKRREAYEYRASARLITYMALVYFVFNLLSSHSLIALSISINSLEKTGTFCTNDKNKTHQIQYL